MILNITDGIHLNLTKEIDLIYPIFITDIYYNVS